ncbi:uncharacterized protein FIBRA_08216 [Fibroporia radiculosa]|uniref:C2H2-type domain-containing protein n=1 Tax=Fibroporia radiculosa TaxID=599839 RepID=J4GWE4_9APHY|nr:uncharacterized protein FIBRA_08216 [Fibroporia radiculosa]CCM05975.1 predicted protein [Fibroporia radiculosa]
MPTGNHSNIPIAEGFKSSDKISPTSCSLCICVMNSYPSPFFQYSADPATVPIPPSTPRVSSDVRYGSQFSYYPNGMSIIPPGVGFGVPADQWRVAHPTACPSLAPPTMCIDATQQFLSVPRSHDPQFPGNRMVAHPPGSATFSRTLHTGEMYGETRHQGRTGQTPAINTHPQSQIALVRRSAVVRPGSFIVPSTLSRPEPSRELHQDWLPPPSTPQMLTTSPSAVSRTRCLWTGCTILLDDTSIAGIKRHLAAVHADEAVPTFDAQPGMCKWTLGEHGHECGRGLHRASLGKHIASVHLKSTVKQCPLCHASFSRNDCVVRHMKHCGGS